MDIVQKREYNDMVASSISAEFITLSGLMGYEDNIDKKKVLANIIGILVEYNFSEDINKSKDTTKNRYEAEYAVLNLLHDRLVSKDILLPTDIGSRDNSARGFMLVNRRCNEEIILTLKHLIQDG